MRQILGFLAFCAAAMVWNVASAQADTHAPSTQTFTLVCGSAIVTVVSPTEAARAGQIVGATGVGILQRVLFADSPGETVLFEQPSAQALKASALTSCTQAVPGGVLTVVVLTTPQGNPGA